MSMYGQGTVESGNGTISDLSPEQYDAARRLEKFGDMLRRVEIRRVKGVEVQRSRPSIWTLDTLLVSREVDGRQLLDKRNVWFTRGDMTIEVNAMQLGLLWAVAYGLSSWEARRFYQGLLGMDRGLE